MSDLSIITVTYESAAKISTFLENTYGTAPTAEIVVVDNASTDETRQLVQKASADVRLVCSPENVGFGRGCNLGAEIARGSWLLFVNPDVLLQTVTVPSISPSAGFGLGAGLIATNDQGLAMPGVRAETTRIEDWIQEVWKLFMPRPLSRYITPRRSPVDWPIGGLLMARSDEYQRIGGFDPRYFLFFEDRDLGSRYRKQSLPVHVLDGLVGRHWAGSSSTVASWRREAWSIISWLEYTAIWRGADQATSTASRVLAVLKGISRMASRPVLSDRVRSKAHRAGLIVDFVMDFDDFLPDDSQTYYSYARVAISAAKGSRVA